MTPSLLARLEARPARAFALLAALLVADHFLLGPASYVEINDVAATHLPRYRGALDLWLHQGFFHWMAPLAGGSDRIGNGIRLLDPLALLLLALPDWCAMGVMRGLGFFLSGWGSYLLARRRLGLPAGPAWLAGILAMAAQEEKLELTLGVGLLPLMILALERLIEVPRRLPATALALTLGLAYGMAAPFQWSLIYTLPGVALWFLVVRGSWRPWPLVLLVLFAAASLVTQADIIAAIIRSVGDSSRTGQAITDYGRNIPFPWPTAGAPGAIDLVAISAALAWQVVAMALILGALAVGDRAQRGLGLRLLACVAILAAVIRWNLPIRVTLGELPGLGAFASLQLFKVRAVLPTFLALLAGVGLAALARRGVGRGLAGIAVAGAAAFQAATLAGHAKEWLLQGSWLSHFGSPQVTALGAASRAAAEPFRVASFSVRNWEPDYAMAYGLETVDGRASLFTEAYRRYWDLVREPLDQRLGSNRKERAQGYAGALLGAEDVTAASPGMAARADDYFRTPLLALLNVQALIAQMPVTSPDWVLATPDGPDLRWGDLSRRDKLMRRLGENFRGQDILVYRLKPAAPRWWLAAAAECPSDHQALAEALRGRDLESLRRVALLAPDQAGALCGASFDGDGRITIEAHGPDGTRLTITSAGPALLAASVPFTRHWVARIDGAATPILPAYLALGAVALPQGGRHEVRFDYQPPWRAIP